jgi:Mg2+/Co2+ transporter CorC
MPERGEEVIIEDYQFKIISSSSRRINNLQVTLLPEAKSVSSGAA